MADRKDNRDGSLGGLGLLLGGIVVAAFLIFLTTGGELGGTKKVESDADLPLVSSPEAPAGDPALSENTGSR